MLEIGPRPLREHPNPKHWEEVRNAALARDGGCRLCGDTSRLEVHHRSYERWGRELPSDLTTLCRDCHDLITGAQMKMRAERREWTPPQAIRPVVEKIDREPAVLPGPQEIVRREIERAVKEANTELPPPFTVRRW